MRVPIPQDWDGETWQCIQIEWPVSDEWIGLLQGILTLLTRGRYWDENTGSIKDVQEIAWEIFNRSYPFISCDGDVLPPTDPTPILCAGGGGCCDCCEGEMCMSCITDVTIEDGVIYKWYGPCCKIAIGTVTTIDVPADPGDDDPEDPSEWPCNKAAGIAVEFGDIIDTGVTLLQSTSPGTVTPAAPYQQAWLRAFPAIPWDRDELWGAMLWYSGHDAEIEADVLGADFEQWLVCSWSTVLLPTSGLSRDEHQSLVNAQYRDFATSTTRFMSFLVSAAGQPYFSRLAQSYYAETADCTCPDADVYDGLVTFEDFRSIILESQGATLDVATLEAPNIMYFEVKGGQNSNFQEVHWDEDLVASGDIQEMEIEFALESADVPGFYPAKDWTDTNPTPLANYMQPDVQAPSQTVKTYYPSPGRQVAILTWAAPSDLDGASVDFGVKLNPKDQDPDVQTYKFRAEITYAGPLR